MRSRSRSSRRRLRGPGRQRDDARPARGRRGAAAARLHLAEAAAARPLHARSRLDAAGSTPASKACTPTRIRRPPAPRVLLATEMEPSNARRLLPCWDEPSFRARFRLSVDLPAGFAGYSNMPVERREALPGGGQRLAFAPTPRMASYLLALVAGELERVTAEADGTELGVVVTAGKAGRAQYALDAGKQLLPYYGDYFGTRYPLPKLDQIGVPGGFGGAMENWGAIVYTEAALLVDPASSPEQTRQIVYGTVAHEIAHQWLGNLVTMAWWDDLWLNESFAEWMAIKASERFHPEWRVALQANEGRELAMDLDARASTHPIHQPIATESEAESAFDRITYEKGGGFLRMLEAWLGEEPFRRGIRAYLAKHRYSQYHRHRPVAGACRRLRRAGGDARRRLDDPARLSAGLGRCALRGRTPRGDACARSSSRPSPASSGAATRRWSIPLQLGSGDGGPETRVLLQAPSATRVLPGCDGALLVDAGNVGFYRVRYAPPLFDALLAAWPRLPDAARLKLLSDTGALVRADQVALASWLDLVARLGDEPRLALWTRVVDELAGFDRLLLDEPSRPALDRFAVRLIAPRFAAARLGGEGGRVRRRPAAARPPGRRARAPRRCRRDRRKPGPVRALPRRPRPACRPALLDSGAAAASAATPTLATWEQLRALAAAGADQRGAIPLLPRPRRRRAIRRSPSATCSSRSRAEVPRLMRRRDGRAWSPPAATCAAAWAFAREHADALLADTTVNGGGRYFGRVVDSAASAAIADELEAFVAAPAAGRCARRCAPCRRRDPDPGAAEGPARAAARGGAGRPASRAAGAGGTMPRSPPGTCYMNASARRFLSRRALRARRLRPRRLRQAGKRGAGHAGRVGGLGAGAGRRHRRRLRAVRVAEREGRDRRLRHRHREGGGAEGRPGGEVRQHAVGGHLQRPEAGRPRPAGLVDHDHRRAQADDGLHRAVLRRPPADRGARRFEGGALRRPEDAQGRRADRDHRRRGDLEAAGQDQPEHQALRGHAAGPVGARDRRHRRRRRRQRRRRQLRQEQRRQQVPHRQRRRRSRPSSTASP